MKQSNQHWLTALWEAARTKPDAVALSDGQTVLSYAQLACKVQSLGHELACKGVQSGDRVALYLPRSADLIVALLAVLHRGAVMVPMGPHLPLSACQQRLAQAGVSHIVADGPCPQFSGWAIAVDVGSASLNDESLEALPLSTAPQSPLYILFTSGSTGVPKGVVVPNGALRRHIEWKTQTYPVDAGCGHLHKAPLSFDVAMREIFEWLELANQLVIVPEGAEADPEHLCRLIGANQCQELSIVPSFLDAFIHYVDVFGLAGQLACLKRVLVGGEALGGATVNRFKAVFAGLGVKLINLYGPTEATIEVTHFDCDELDLADGDDVPIGRAIYSDSLQMMDDGELVICGSQVALGYLGGW